MYRLKQVIGSEKKRLVLYALGYLAIGYGVTLGGYLLSNPGYLMSCPPELAPYKCTGVIGLIRDLAVRSDFWFDVLTWPVSLPIHLLASD